MYSTLVLLNYSLHTHAPVVLQLLLHKEPDVQSYLAFPNLPGVPPVFFFFIADPLTSGLSTYEKGKK